MANIQGGILSAKNRGRHVAVLLFAFRDPAQTGKNTKFVRAAAPKVTTAQAQYERFHRKRRSAVFRSFMLTAKGLEACGVTKDGANAEFFPQLGYPHPNLQGPFLDMNNLGEGVPKMLLDDVDGNGRPTTWEPKYLDRIDGAWVLGHATKAGVERALRTLEKWGVGQGIVTVKTEFGEVPRGTIKREVFGFRDGVSMPFFFKERPGALDTGLEDIFLAGPGPNRGGSFMVLRKLEQDVPAFLHVRNNDGVPEVEKLVGRRLDGEPLAARPGARHPNDFDFSTDPEGAQCPFHAHIRRLNPRSGLVDPSHRLRIVRRGVVYGLPENLADAGKSGSGLMFLAYMNHPGVFDTMQGNWTLHTRHFDAPAGTRKDLLLLGPPPGTCPGVTRWITPKGGAYFYVPSRSWLEKLGTTTKPT